MPPLLAGAMLGVGGTVLLAFAIIIGFDNRYLTRREHTIIITNLNQQLKEIKSALGVGGHEHDG
jgi:hypothetical protein